MNRVPHYMALGIALLGLAGCQHFMREEVGIRLAHSAWMIEREIPAAPFSLTSYERIHEKGSSANVYIEGDGMAWQHMSDDATPENPVALHLATKDSAENVIYLARPCQYSGMLGGGECEKEYATTRRYAPEVLRAYDEALNDIAKLHNIEGFNLIGYDGGAVIAAALAQERHDILSLRTVAGKLHEIPNPAGLADVPQRHFIGGQDEIVKPAQLHNYMQEAQANGCLQYEFIQENTHEKGWPDKWPELLTQPIHCAAPVTNDLPEFIPFEPGVYTTPESTKP